MKQLSNTDNLSVKPSIPDAGINAGIRFTKRTTKTYLQLLAACGIFLFAVFLLPRELTWTLKATLGITLAAIWLWVTEPVSMALTALIAISSLTIFKAVPFETALSGFANGSTFLIMAGFMMAQGVNSTSLGKRFADWMIIRFGGSTGGVLMGVLLAPQVLSFFIPATAVRTTLLLPAVLALLKSMNLNRNSNAAKLLIFGLSFGASISGVGLLPAAISNVLTVDLLRTAGLHIYYFTWLKITWPIWILMIPLTWIILLKVFPPDIETFEVDTLKKALRALGKLTPDEKRILIILIITVILWMTESIHKIPTAVPAIVSVILMGLPGVGNLDWDKLKNIEWGTVLLMGATLSIATSLNQSGAAEFLANKLLAFPGLQHGLSKPLLAVISLTVLTHIYHLGVTNVSTVVLTLIPVVMQLSLKVGLNPMLAAITIGMAALFGFLLSVETLPGVITYATGIYSTRELLWVGFWLTLVSILVILVCAVFWWQFIGLV